MTPGDPQSRAERPRQIKPASRLAWAVHGNQPEGQHHRDDCQRDVDEEHRLPAQRLREHSAEQHAHHQPRGACAAPDREPAVAFGAFGEAGVDERQGGREDQRSAKPLHGAGDEQHLGRRGQASKQRRAGVEREARDEDPPPPEQVGGAAAEEQEAGGRHGVSADHRLEGLRGVIQCAPDLGQRHHHDVLIQGDDQHRKREQRQRGRGTVAAWPFAGGCSFGTRHSWTPVNVSRPVPTIRYAT
jgi:hypothetical protein